MKTTITTLLALTVFGGAAFAQINKAQINKPVAPAPPSQIGITANTPEEVLVLQQEDLLNDAGEKALRAGHYEEAETDYRTIQSIDALDAGAYQGLGEALAGQGRVREALQAYQTLIYKDPFKWSSIAQEVRTQMYYAALLGQTGHWVEAVSIYEKALPNVPKFGDTPLAEAHFNPRLPMPTQLWTMAHIASGLQWQGSGENKAAFIEFSKAISLDSDSAFANYYFGYGWQRLDPKDKANFGNAQQAKAALEKAVKLGKPDVKEAAQKALLVAAKP